MVTLFLITDLSYEDLFQLLIVEEYMQYHLKQLFNVSKKTIEKYRKKKGLENLYLEKIKYGTSINNENFIKTLDIYE